jgi:protein 64 protein
MAKILKRLFIVVAALVCITSILTGLTACTEAEKVTYNLQKDADYFNCERRITVYNARTDTIILEVEGYMSLSNDVNDELVVTVKTGANEYKINYIYLNDYTLYVVEDITGTHTDPYHYQMYFHTEFPFTVETKP